MLQPRMSEGVEHLVGRPELAGGGAVLQPRMSEGVEHSSAARPSASARVLQPRMSEGVEHAYNTGQYPHVVTSATTSDVGRR